MSDRKNKQSPRAAAMPQGGADAGANMKAQTKVDGGQQARKFNPNRVYRLTKTAGQHPTFPPQRQGERRRQSKKTRTKTPVQVSVRAAERPKSSQREPRYLPLLLTPYEHQLLFAVYLDPPDFDFAAVSDLLMLANSRAEAIEDIHGTCLNEAALQTPAVEP